MIPNNDSFGNPPPAATCGVVPSTETLKDTIIRRVGVDLGTNRFKVMVADVNVTRASIEILFTKMVIVNLGEDLAENKRGNGSLSEEIQEGAKQAITELLKDVRDLKPSEISGICTAVFRKASNGKALLSDLNKIVNTHFAISQNAKPRLQEIDQSIEGMLGFQTAVALHSAKPAKDIVSFDSGGGSFQISRKKEDGTFEVFEGPFGSASAIKLFVEEVRKVPYAKEHPINPITKEEITKLVDVLQSKLQVPEWLQQKLAHKDTHVVSWGEKRAMVAKILQKTNFTSQEVDTVLQMLAGKSDKDEIISKNDNPRTVVVSVALLSAVMKKFNIQSIHFVQTTGSIAGLFISPQFWPSIRE